MYKFILIFLVTTQFLGCQGFKSSSSPAAENQSKEIPDYSGGVIIDVRTPQEFEAGYIENAHLYDWLSDDFESAIEHLDKDTTYYLYCRTGNRSGQAMQLMKRAGFKKVFNIGSYNDLKSNGLPVIEPEKIIEN